MDFIKKNWLTLALLAGCLAFGSLWGFGGSGTRRDLANARSRIVDLKDSLEKSAKYASELELGLENISKEHKKLEDEHSELREAYFRIRDYHSELEEGNNNLEGSNSRSLELVRRGLEILAEKESNDSGS